MAFISIAKSKTDISEDKALQDNLKMNMLQEQWTELRGAIRKHVPYHLMHVTCLDVTQFDCAIVSNEVEEVLTSIRTDQLSLKYESRVEAQKILGRISYNPGATLYMHELSFNEASEPLIPPGHLLNVKDIWFCGDILPADFITLLSSAVPSLCLTCDRLREECLVIVREYIKSFLDGSTNQTSCRISASGGLLRHVFEDLAGVGEDYMANGPRQVHLISALEETPIHCFIDAVNTCT
ncbi:unnamed protein product [Strongylus vulgaris]|uniref:Uncharacterized protein n=1 Tax=Strongylus vulgaris TaxID=40348 RepID=A0A3P7IP95_STRVU|nr:unnamed protein product [Strongylus vulgaris]